MRTKKGKVASFPSHYMTPTEIRTIVREEISEAISKVVVDSGGNLRLSAAGCPSDDGWRSMDTLNFSEGWVRLRYVEVPAGVYFGIYGAYGGVWAAQDQTNHAWLILPGDIEKWRWRPLSQNEWQRTA